MWLSQASALTSQNGAAKAAAHDDRHDREMHGVEQR
jgi:hypothetical protein